MASLKRGLVIPQAVQWYHMQWYHVPRKAVAVISAAMVFDSETGATDAAVACVCPASPLRALQF